ncbi:hypothetical protein PoB_005075900 [Plakobranchus ocellatus]|uniref:Uncharacterized protein n=1 Tax=Plakobranchus ocellatus TaxID=259542 RepID=A0AAV4C0P0_9GAST|nr:hypothetical protein PoB_005075900 [Plakobranchus ocellatus]
MAELVFSLKPDLDHLYNSDSDVELEDDENLTKLTRQKKPVWRDGTRHVKNTPRFDSSTEESSDDPAIYSNSDHDEPGIDIERLVPDKVL